MKLNGDENEVWNKKLNGYFIAFNRRVFRWSPAYRNALKVAFVRRDKEGEWYRCADCKDVVLRKFKQVDHTDPVVDRGGWHGDWNLYRDRMHVSAEKLRVLCKQCHSKKTKKENAERRKAKKQKKAA